MLRFKEVKSVLNKHRKRDSWFLDDYSVNPYEGCSCNCQYCYIRGSKYGLNMDEGLVVKSNAPDVLEKQLRNRARKDQYGFVAVGSATDAYIHHEEKLGRTEAFLRLFLKYRFPVFISTKCTLLKRDIPILQEIDREAILPADLKDRLGRGVILSVSISTMDEAISQTLEPGAASPAERMELVSALAAEGFLVGVNAIPTLPYISDTESELERIISTAKAHQAAYILVGSLTLFGDQPSDSRTLYYRFLERHYPALIPAYRQLFGNNFSVPASYQESLKQKVDKLCRQYHIRNQILPHAGNPS